MPLLPGKSNSVKSANISELRHSGYPEKQAIAIAYSKSGEGKKAKKPKRKAPHASKNLGAFHHPKGAKLPKAPLGAGGEKAPQAAPPLPKPPMMSMDGGDAGMPQMAPKGPQISPSSMQSPLAQAILAQRMMKQS